MDPVALAATTIAIASLPVRSYFLILKMSKVENSCPSVGALPKGLLTRLVMAVGLVHGTHRIFIGLKTTASVIYCNGIFVISI